MSRKILSIIVAVAFVLTTISTAFAATLPSDVTSDCATAVSEMQSLNIMVGDAGTGLFRPADTIKRSEFAVVAVKAMGLNDTATISAGATKFTDVAADNWASGYINAAVGAGLISGYPDGTFKPDATINYAEAVTILANMLGYGPILAGKPWPGAYVAQANASGITSGVVMATSVGASRGNVAKLVSNTLGANELQISSYDVSGKPIYSTTLAGTNGAATTKTLMADKLSVTQITNTPTNATVAAKEYTVDCTPSVLSYATQGANTTLKDTTYGVVLPTKYDFVSTLNPDDYLGLNINAYTNSDGKICVAEITNSPSDIYDGIVSQDGTAAAPTFHLVDKSASYSTAAAATIYLNGVASNCMTVWNAMNNNVKLQGRVVLSNGLISFMSLWGDVGTTATSYSYVVNTIDSGYIRAIGGTPADLEISTVKSNIAQQLDMYTFIKNGKPATIDDIKANDAITQVTNGSHITYIVSENEIKGSLTAISGTSNSMTLTIGGTAYNFAKTIFISNDGTIGDASAVADVTVSGSDCITNFVGQNVVVELNAVGEIALMNSTTATATYYYGIVKNFASNVGANLDDAVVLYKNDGTKVSYLFDEDSDITGMNATATGASVTGTIVNSNPVQTIVSGDLVQYALTSAGKIADKSLTKVSNFVTAATDTDGQVVGTTTGTGNEFSNNYITPDAGSSTAAGIINSSTAIFNVGYLLNQSYSATMGTDANLIPYSAIDGTKQNATFITKNGLVTAIVINSTNINAGTSGVVANTGYDSNGKTITVNVDGTTKVYEDNDTGSTKTNDWTNEFIAGQFINFNVDSSGKISGTVPVTNLNTNLNLGAGAYANGNPSVSTFIYNNANIYRVISIDTSNNVLKVEKLLPTYTADSTLDYYFRFDPANLNVYDATDKANNNIKGGLTMANISQYDYVWLGGEGDASTDKYDFSRLVKLNVNDITQTNGTH